MQKTLESNKIDRLDLKCRHDIQKKKCLYAVLIRFCKVLIES